MMNRATPCYRSLRYRFLCYLILSLLIPVIGCGSPPPKSADQQVSYPQQFQTDGETWKAAELSSRLQTKLTQFLEQNPDYQQHPALQAEPRPYQSTAGKVRIYWIPAYSETPLWLMYRDQDGGKLEEGIGNPFSE